MEGSEENLCLRHLIVWLEDRRVFVLVTSLRRSSAMLENRDDGIVTQAKIQCLYSGRKGVGRKVSRVGMPGSPSLGVVLAEEGF
jgi:hypothetical protein